MEKNLEKDFMHINANDILIREAGISDLPGITEIYNEAVINGIATFDTEIKSIDNRREWLKQHGGKHPVLVAFFDHEMIGWASLTRYSDRSAYDGTAEVSVYIHANYRAKGVGSIMFQELIKRAQFLGLHYLMSRITQGNETSIRLHQRNGFNLVGVMHEVGYKFGTYLDVTIMERVIKN
ncbi:MAG: GNAT family N-acetyltransferase [bacterium]|nr:GNAT family N-acetyltransferase [bacterium]